MQHDLLVTPYQIRQGLGDTYLFLQEKDSKREFRRHQNKLRKLLENKARHKKLSCALCCSEPIYVAHIESLEEGGDNDLNNLIPLCKACHEAFDHGDASLNEMRKVRESWPIGDGSWLKREMKARKKTSCKDTFQESKPASVIREREEKEKQIRKLIEEEKYVKAVARIQELEGRGTTELEYWLKIKLIDVNRRRGKCGKLEEALDLADQLSKASIPQEYEGDFYYQAGYANLEFGCHSLAIDFFRKSLKTLPRCEIRNRIGTRMLILQATVAGRQDLDWNQAEAELRDLQESSIQGLQGAGENTEADRRWQHNCALSAVRFYLARGRDEDIEHASLSWSQASKLWAEMTANRGWHRGSRSTIGYVRGYLITAKLEKQERQMNVEREELLRVLGMLARGVVLLIGKGWNFPQECRDLLFATRHVLNACGEEEHSKKVGEVAGRVRDGCSWKAPYRAHPVE